MRPIFKKNSACIYWKHQITPSNTLKTPTSWTSAAHFRSWDHTISEQKSLLEAQRDVAHLQMNCYIRWPTVRILGRTSLGWIGGTEAAHFWGKKWWPHLFLTLCADKKAMELCFWPQWLAQTDAAHLQVWQYISFNQPLLILKGPTVRVLGRTYLGWIGATNTAHHKIIMHISLEGTKLHHPTYNTVNRCVNRCGPFQELRSHISEYKITLRGPRDVAHLQMIDISGGPL